MFLERPCQRNRLLDKKYLQEVLRREGIDIPQNLFTEPLKQDAITVFRGFICLVLGYDIRLRSKSDLRVFLAERATESRPGSLPLESSLVQSLKMSMFLPDNGEKHLAGVALMVLFRCLQQLGDICGIDDVTLGDILRPTGYRMLVFASAVADYIHFQQTYMQDACKKWEEVRQDQEEIYKTKQKTVALREEIDALAARADQRRQELQELEVSEHHVKEELKQTASDLEEAKSKASAAELESHTAALRLKESEDKIHQLNTELVELKSQIVESPSRITQSLKDIEEQLDKTDKILRDASQKLPAIQLHYDVLQCLRQRLKHAADLLEELDTVSRRSQQLIDKVTQKQKTAKTLEAALDVLCKEEEKLREDLDQLGRQLEETTEATQASEQAREKTKRARERAEQLRVQCQQKLKSSNTQLKKIQKELDSLKQEESMLQTMSDAFWSQLQDACRGTEEMLLRRLQQHVTHLHENEEHSRGIKQFVLALQRTTTGSRLLTCNESPKTHDLPGSPPAAVMLSEPMNKEEEEQTERTTNHQQPAGRLLSASRRQNDAPPPSLLTALAPPVSARGNAASETIVLSASSIDLQKSCGYKNDTQRRRELSSEHTRRRRHPLHDRTPSVYT